MTEINAGGPVSRYAGAMAIRSIARPGASQPAPPPEATATFALFNLGFRPFYFVAATYAALSIPLWLLVWAGLVPMRVSFATQWWHTHEMVFGFALAVVIGFLLTAARAWTGIDTPSGNRLVGLVALWLGARIFFHAGLIVAGVVIELVLIVLAASAILRVLVAAGNRRNLFVVLILAVLGAMDIAFALAAGGWIAWSPDAPLRAALYLIVMLTAVFGGRVIPSFTANALMGIRQFQRPWLDTAAIVAAIAALLADLVLAGGLVVALLAGIAALVHALRLAGWNPLATRRKPILWILHAAYAWMPIGFALLACSALGLVARPLALHAFAVGLIGGLIIGMITRTALGHTGRPLAAGGSETTMYLLVMFAALTRVVGPLLLPAQTLHFYVVSGIAWAGAFALYAIVYWPRLSQPRIDGRPG